MLPDEESVGFHLDLDKDKLRCFLVLEVYRNDTWKLRILGAREKASKHQLKWCLDCGRMYTRDELISKFLTNVSHSSWW